MDTYYRCLLKTSSETVGHWLSTQWRSTYKEYTRFWLHGRGLEGNVHRDRTVSLFAVLDVSPKLTVGLHSKLVWISLHAMPLLYTRSMAGAEVRGRRMVGWVAGMMWWVF